MPPYAATIARSKRSRTACCQGIHTPLTARRKSLTPLPNTSGACVKTTWTRRSSSIKPTTSSSRWPVATVCTTTSTVRQSARVTHLDASIPNGTDSHAASLMIAPRTRYLNRRLPRSRGDPMRFHILGHISLRIDDRPVKLGPPKARGLLGVLLLSPGALVPVDKIVNALWEEPFDPARTRQPVKGREPPKRPYKAVQIHVTKLRAALKDAGVLVSLRYEHGAYRLTVDQEDVDYYQFRQLVLTAREAAREGDHRRAVDLFQAATALWDGPPLADLRTPWADQQRHDLVVNDLLPAYYRLFEEYQTLGEFSRMISGLRPLLSEYDTDETFARQWMAALAMVNGKDQVRNFYRMFADRLRSTLDEQPSDQLVAFYEQLMRPTSSGTRQTAVGALSTLPEQLPRTAAHFTGRSS